MLTPQKGACCGPIGHKGDVSVPGRPHRFGAFAVLATAAAVGGCANVDLSVSGGWFQKPLDVFGRNAGYSYSELGEAKRQQRPITANDLVEANGSCPAPPAPSAPAPAPVAAAPATGATASAAPAAPMPSAPVVSETLLGGGVALGMSECDVVYRAGPPSLVQIGASPAGYRTAVLTYNGGPRPGVYHFERGQLMQMDRVAEPAPEPAVAKKKPAKPNKQAAKD
jgi:hypothetical protein